MTQPIDLHPEWTLPIIPGDAAKFSFTIGDDAGISDLTGYSASARLYHHDRQSFIVPIACGICYGTDGTIRVGIAAPYTAVIPPGRYTLEVTVRNPAGEAVYVLTDSAIVADVCVAPVFT